MTDYEANKKEPEEESYYKIQFSLDGDGFFRRACSECGLHFKTKADAEEVGDLLSPTFRRIEKEYDIILSPRGQNSEEPAEPVTLGCPYCGHFDKPQNMLTDEFSQFFLRWAKRELVYPQIKNFYDEMDKMFNRNRRTRSRGLFSIEMRFEHEDVTIPVRPISGPELADMIRVDLLCCDKVIKIASGWLDKIHCPFCSKELILQ